MWQSTSALSLAGIHDQAQSECADLSALAMADSHSALVLVWNYHNDDLPTPPAEIAIALNGVPAATTQLRHYRIDHEHSNAYATWLALGSPQQVSATQRQALEQAGQLALLAPPTSATTRNGQAVLHFALPRRGVSLLYLTW